jgi:hypothetical protein
MDEPVKGLNSVAKANASLLQIQMGRSAAIRLKINTLLK